MFLIKIWKNIILLDLIYIYCEYKKFSHQYLIIYCHISQSI